ncbi:MAG: HD family phosphohydrolase [Sporolactobacillus sp.]
MRAETSFGLKLRNLLVHHLSRWGIFAAAGVVLYALMVGSVLPKSPNVRLHEIATEDIQSPIDAVDADATKAKRQEAMSSTPSAYTYDRNLALMQVEMAGDLFDTVKSVKDADKLGGSSPQSQLTAAVQKVASHLSAPSDHNVSDTTLQTLLTASDRDLQIAEDITSTGIYEAMSGKVGWTDLQRVQDKAIASLPSAVLNDPMRTALNDVLRAYITANYTFDAAATKRNKQEAASSVDDVMIHQGEVIVRKGELVTNDMIRQLRLVGLMDGHFDVLPFLGLLLFTAFVTGIFSLEYQRFSHGRGGGVKYLYMDLLIFLGTAAIINICSYFVQSNISGIGYIVPVAFATLLLRSLLNERIAVVSSILFALIGSVAFGVNVKAAIFDAPMAIYLFFSSVSGAVIVRRGQLRPKVLQTGVYLAIVNIAALFALILFQNVPITFVSTGAEIGFAVLSALLSVILANGLLPLFETAFDILSPMRLVELSNPSQPLLRKILLEAPGTYHHSVMVANLAERACEAIGANGLLARVAAYYHDIGKTKRPRFFVENQLDGVNPHDKISPQLSRTILVAHPNEGAKILRDNRIPKEIVAIAEQHHGTSLIRYFYVKACEIAGEQLPESEFRYPGPKVQTKEAAVVELADSVEAAVRAMKKPTPAKVQNVIQTIFNERLSDGQFDECNITLKELKQVVKSIDETLRGVYHSRVEYPKDIKLNKVNEK